METEFKCDQLILINEVWDLSDFDDLGVRFNWLKFKIREFAIPYCIKRGRTRRERQEVLMKEIEKLDNKYVMKLLVILN